VSERDDIMTGSNAASCGLTVEKIQKARRLMEAADAANECAGVGRTCVRCCHGPTCPMYGAEHAHVAHRCESRREFMRRLRAMRDGYHHPDLPR